MVVALLAIVMTVLSFPSAPLDFYKPHHTANLFLPNYGYESQYSTQANVYPTMLLSYNYNKVIMELVNGDVMKYTKVSMIFDIISSISVFILISYFFTNNYKLSLCLGLILGFFSNYQGLTIIALILPLYFILKYLTSGTSRSIYVSLFFLTYGIGIFIWHSLSMALLVTFLSILFVSYFYTNSIDRQNTVHHKICIRLKKSHHIYITLLCSIIAGVSWVYVRTRQFRAALSPAEATQLFDPYYFLRIIVNKGSDLPAEFNYIRDFIIPLNVIDLGRYLLFVTIYIYVLVITFKYVRGKFRPKLIEVLLVALVIADISLKVLYYIFTGIINIAIMTSLIVPIFLIYIFIQYNTSRRNAIKAIYFSLALFAIIITILTSMSVMYVNQTQCPSGETNFDSYTNSIQWLVSHLNDETSVITDADTGGYWQIIYTKEKLYQHSEINVLSLSQVRYKQLIYHNLDKYGSALFIFNKMISDKNLMLHSLESWKKFKPISKSNYDENGLNSLYNDDLIIIYA
jgi:hypothetical protein